MIVEDPVRVNNVRIRRQMSLGAALESTGKERCLSFDGGNILQIKKDL